jgi:type IV pilus assembly protein PilQ
MRLTRGFFLALSLLAPASLAFADASIRKVEVTGQGERAEILIEGAFDVPTYSVRARNDGKTVVIDVADASLPDGGVSTKGKTSLVKGAVASTTASGARIEVSLTEPLTYKARAENGAIRIELSRMDAAQDVKPTVRKGEGPLTVENVLVERRDGRDRVVIETSSPVEYRIANLEDGLSRMELRGARLSPRLDQEWAGAPSGIVRKVRAVLKDGRTYIEVEGQDAGTTTAIREGNRIVWLFAPEASMSARRATKTVARDESLVMAGEEASTDDVASFLTDIPMQSKKGEPKYSGRRIDLDFKNADIHDILRLLSDVGGVNVVTADNVSGSVTIKMRDVPWDQALDVVLQAKGLGMLRRGNLVRVAPLGTLEKEREAAIARLKQREQLAPLETRLVPVSYATASALQPRVRELLSSRGTVSVDERTNMLIVRDIIDNLDDVESLVRTLDTQTPQVLVEARIVEATTAYVREVGIQWGGDTTFSTATGNPTGLVFPNSLAIGGGAGDRSAPTGGLVSGGDNFVVNLPAIAGNGAGGALGITMGSIDGTVNMAVRLSAAESTGTVRIISSPRVLTLDNYEATISQGTLIPYSQVSAQGVQTAFQNAQLQLRVKPHVTSDGSVAMAVNVTRDEPDFSRTSARGDPTILKREANTNLLVADGHTAVIGGIFTRNASRNLNQVPFFGDIPILGLLFQNRRVRDERNELLIFLTPRIVNRAESLGT